MPSDDTENQTPVRVLPSRQSVGVELAAEESISLSCSPDVDFFFAAEKSIAYS